MPTPEEATRLATQPNPLQALHDAVNRHDDQRALEPLTQGQEEPDKLTGAQERRVSQAMALEREQATRQRGDDNVIGGNVMRHVYRELTPAQQQRMLEIKNQGLVFYRLLDGTGASRELSLAKTKIEEAVMWAVKHITR